MPVHIETQEIRVFKAVCDESGFNKAAEKLFVTQSAVSQTVANLEKKLDTKLLERNPLKLTETGIRLLNYAETVLGEEDIVLSDIRDIRHGILSTLSLAISSSVNSVFGEQLITKYVEDSPLTKLKINIMPSRQIITAISSDLWELGFGPFQQQMPPIFTTLPMFEDSRKLMISGAGRDTTADISGLPLIVSHLDDPDMRPAIDKLRDTFGTIWEVNDLSLRINLVVEGRGMTYLDDRILARRDDCKNLVHLDNQVFSTIPLTFGLYHRRNKQLSSGARRFIEVCTEFEFAG